MQPCHTCGGTGRCPQCGGKGKVFLGKCTMCSGTGMCPDCQITALEAKLWNSSTDRTIQSKRDSAAETILTNSKQICPLCGQVFEGDKCWDCVARKADIEETFSLCIPVALGGITIGDLIAIGTFPPLISNFPMVYTIPALFFAGATMIMLMLGKRQTRHANFVRFTILLVTLSFVTPAAYFFLNGMLDSSPSVEVPSRVIAKAIQKRGARVLAVDLEWNQKRIEENIQVSHDTYSAVEPGDTVRVVIHPGAFSQPWYDNVLTSSTGTSDLRQFSSPDMSS